jgi:hypothetical protein
MLEVLCGRRWDANGALQIFDEIEAENPSSYYSPVRDFPFLGERLLDLQKYVKGCNPKSIRAIWYDQRNPASWLTFWVCYQETLLRKEN